MGHHYRIKKLIQTIDKRTRDETLYIKKKLWIKILRGGGGGGTYGDSAIAYDLERNRTMKH